MRPEHNRQSGALLLELALALALLALMALPLMRLNHSQKTQQALLAKLQEKQRIMEQIEGFVLSHKRLPCPADQKNLQELYQNGQCQQASGWFPAASLGLPAPQTAWQMSVSTLEQVGPPAAHIFFAPQALNTIGLAQLSEIVFSPLTPNSGVEETALPALHVCILDPAQPLPAPTQHGCGPHVLQTATAVLVVYEAGSQTGAHQFFIQPNAPEQNPTWLSYERLVWLWMRAGVLDQATTE